MRALWLTLAVLVADQITKTLVVHRMRLYETIPLVGDWFKFTYTTNPGMAFGLTFGPPGLITVFAVAATALIIVYLWRIRGAYPPYRLSLALILGGALGNILDRIFYGLIYGYGPLFQGQVVDFIHVDLGVVDLPLFGPRRLFPIWNVADMAIVVGVVGFMIFQGAFHRQLAAGTAPDPLTDDESPDQGGAPVAGDSRTDAPADVTTTPAAPESR
jgi:signal peptidase II